MKEVVSREMQELERALNTPDWSLVTRIERSSGEKEAPGGPGALRSGCAWDHAGECEQRQGQTSVRGRATHGELRRRTQQSSGVSPALVGYAVPEPV